MARTSNRVKIMDVAQDAILAKGFDATSIDEITAAADVTRGAFFYHFADKNALALALIDRHIEFEDNLFDDIMSRADDLADDPLQSALIALKLLAELLEDMENGHPGCIVATAAYQERLFDRNVRDANRRAVLGWRRRFRGMFDRIAEVYPPNEDVEFEALADFVSTVIEGGIVMAKSLGEPRMTAGQVLLLRTYVKLLFSPRPVA